jgi:hypothetical protein
MNLDQARLEANDDTINLNIINDSITENNNSNNNYNNNINNNNNNNNEHISNNIITKFDPPSGLISAEDNTNNDSNNDSNNNSYNDSNNTINILQIEVQKMEIINKELEFELEKERNLRYEDNQNWNEKYNIIHNDLDNEKLMTDFMSTIAIRNSAIAPRISPSLHIKATSTVSNNLYYFINFNF